MAAGRPAAAVLQALQPGRPYRLAIRLNQDQWERDEGAVAVEARAEGEVLWSGWLARLQPHAALRLVPREGVPVIVAARLLGTSSGAAALRLEALPEPLERMPGAGWLLSPNRGFRPQGIRITALVVHATVTPTLPLTTWWFRLPRSRVSAHYVVDRDGTVVQMAEDWARAWHAGVSELEGQEGVNDFSVGIELVNLNDGRDPFTDAQYEAAAAILRHLRQEHAIPDSRVVSHAHVARPAGRKSDPVGFDFARLLRLAAEEWGSVPVPRRPASGSAAQAGRRVR